MNVSTIHRSIASLFGAAVILCVSPGAQAQLGGLLNGLGNTVDSTVNNTTSAVNDLVSSAAGTVTSTLDSVLNTIGDVTGVNLSSSAVNDILPGSSATNSLNNAIETLGPNNSIVFSRAVRDTIAANSLPAPIAQRIASFQGLGAATRDIGGRLLQLRAGRYLSGSRQKLDNEFSDDGGKVIEFDDGSYLVVFAQGDGIDLQIDNYGIARSLDARTYVGTVAVEYHPNDYQAIGLAGSWTETDADLGNGLGSSDVSGGIISAYASWYDGPFYLDGLLAYGRLDHDISRTALNSRTAFGDTESDAFAAQFNTGAHMDVGPFVTGPYLQAEYNRTEIEGYRERGSGLFDLAVDGQDFDSLTSELGWQISMPIETAGGYIAPVIRVGWDHQYLGDDTPVNARLINFSSNKISSRPLNLEDDYLILGAGLVINKKDTYTVSLDYEAEIADDFLRQAASVMVSIPF